jgi:predicted metalloprotease with PDZ domain
VRTLPCLVALAATLLASPPAAPAEARRATLSVDASDAPRRILHARMTLPARPGALTLRYPKWIPGEHGPTGPLADVAGLVIRAGGKTLAWQRDDVDLYAVHTTVPSGASSVEVAFDYLAPGDRGGYSSGGSTTAQLLALEWNLVVMYPDNVPQSELSITPSLTLPHGWKWGSSLEAAHTHGDSVTFKPLSLVMLVDSPVIAGAFFRSYPLGPGGKEPPHQLDVVADSEAALQIEPSYLAGLKRLVVEAGALFGSRHYHRYHFLLTLSDKVAHFGLEHHQSSDNRTRERMLVDAEARKLAASLMPHEFVHSWNGKFRRPAGLATGGFDKPMKGDLLWVYEGLTSYLAWVLAGRSGLETPSWSHEELAAIADSMETRAGRRWRPLEDTAVAAQVIHGHNWQSWRRSLDYYPEGVLLWLDVDATIRQRSGGAKSLDDFCHAFYGGPNHGPEVKPYTFDDIVAALDSVVANDWRGFLRARVDAVTPHAPLGGLATGGWRLGHSDKPNARLEAIAKLDKTETYIDSLGFILKQDGEVVDVAPGTPAYRAGLGPGMKIVAVDGRKLGHDTLPDALRLGKGKRAPLELLVLNADYFKTIKVDYHGGLRQPHLERESGKADLLEAITRPRQTSISPTK